MLRTLTRLGVVRGLLGGNRGWLMLGGLAAGLRLVGRMASKQPDVVFCENLEPGESLVITHLTHHVR